MSKLREAAEKVEMRPGDKLGAITVGLHDDPGIVLLRRIVDSISIVNKMACWDHFAMFELRDYLCERAALSAPAEPQEAAEPVVIAGRYTAYPQRGTPNHCFNAQVFGPDGLSVATFDSTADPRHAYRYAMALADALNAPAPQPAGGEPQPAAQQEPVPEGYMLVLVPKESPGGKPDWDECIRQSEVATGLKVDRNTFSIIKREVRRWLAQCHASQPAEEQAGERKPLTEAQIDRHSIAAVDCPPSSTVILVSSLRRLLGITATKGEPT